MTLSAARPSSAGLPQALAWLLASCVAATLTHGVIGLAGGHAAGADDYAHRAHTAVGPVALAALILGCTALLAAVLSRRGRLQDCDPVSEFLLGLRSRNPFRPGVAVACGSLALLLGMELAEQLAATGRVEGFADALDGNVAAGLATVALVAFLVTLGGLHAAGSLVDAAAAVADALVAWVGRMASPLARAQASSADRVRHRRHASAAAFLAHASGLRAPPRRIV
jgi:hypothetical protein